MYESPKRILLIEDDQTDYLLIKRCFGDMRGRFDLHRVPLLSEGLTQIELQEFHVALCDLGLPDSVGIDTVKAVRDRNPCLSVVVLTSANDAALERAALDAGAQDYLNKSDLTSQSLERILHHAIQRQQQVVETRCMLAEIKASRTLLAEQTALLESKNRRLRRLYRTAQRFVDNVSHEFRTPLTVIKDYVSLVREGLAGPVNDEQARMLDVAAVRTDDLNNMVDDLLDVSKLRAGLLGAWRRNCRLENVVQSLLTGFLMKAQVKKISFLCDVGEDMPELYCDSEKVGRVIINLVTNAMKFCGEPGIVRLWAEARPARGEVLIGVTDNGPGIDPDSIAEIFQRFKQLHGNTRNSTKGFGLGLNIAKELVDLNLGDMHVESQPGHGSTFSFTVPMSIPPVVLQRYLKRTRRLGNAASCVSLIRAVATSDWQAAGADDLDAFLNFFLRRDDLLFRLGECEWLFVLAAPSSEVQHFKQRTEAERVKANRNRPYGPLPAFDLDVAGTWAVPAENERLREHFQSFFERTPAYA